MSVTDALLPSPGTEDLRPAGEQSSYYRKVISLRMKTTCLKWQSTKTEEVWKTDTKMELLHPLGSDSPIAGFLKKNKAGGMHHVCIEVFSYFNPWCCKFLF